MIGMIANTKESGRNSADKRKKRNDGDERKKMIGGRKKCIQIHCVNHINSKLLLNVFYIWEGWVYEDQDR